MAPTNQHNVYSGPNSVKDYYNPDIQPPLPLVELPDSLNPFRADGVRIYAKMMSCLPANNVKSLPALNMLSKSITPDTKTIIEYSSGSTVVSMAVIARALFGIDDVRAYLSNKTSTAKMQMMRFFGLQITLFGGPSQPLPSDPRGGIQKAYRLAAEDPSVLNPNQYENDDNHGAHYRWTGPQILTQLPDITVLAAGLGTAGTMTGIGGYLKAHKPTAHVVAVCTAAGDRVPGPRSYELLLPLKFHWQEVVDSVEEVGSMDSYRLSMQLSREGLICGPSSGFNLQGLYQFLQKLKDEDRLDEIRNSETGEAKAVFVCCDLPYQYLAEYFEKLDESEFKPIHNENLKDVDTYRYDEAWKIDSADLQERFYEDAGYDSGNMSDSSDSGGAVSVPRLGPLLPNAVVLDLRPKQEFQNWHLPGSTNLPLKACEAGSIGPFEDSKVLKEVWTEIEGVFGEGNPYAGAILAGLKGRSVGLLCVDGDVASIASSVLRERGVEAFSIRGGTKAFRTGSERV